jgi:hypothetical protein
MLSPTGPFKHSHLVQDCHDSRVRCDPLLVVDAGLPEC